MISDRVLDSNEFKAAAREREKQTTAAGMIALGVFVGGTASVKKEKPAKVEKRRGGPQTPRRADK